MIVLFPELPVLYIAPVSMIKEPLQLKFALPVTKEPFCIMKLSSELLKLAGAVPVPVRFEFQVSGSAALA